MKTLRLSIVALVICVILAWRDAFLMRVQSGLDPVFLIGDTWSEVSWIVLYSLMWVCLAPLVFFLVRRVSFTRSRWVGPLVFHLVNGFIMAGVGGVLLGVLFGGLVLGAGWPSSPASLLKPFWTDFFVFHSLYNAWVYWMLVAVVVGFDLSDAYSAKKLQAADLERSLTNARLESLKMKLQPHFLFNTLNSIAFLALEKDAAAIETMVERLGHLLEASIDESRGQMVTLNEELSLLDEYLAIQEVRFKDRLRVVRHINPAAAGARVPSLVLQPIVENSIKHGFSRKLGAGCIEVSVRVEGDELVITVDDDGPGLPPGWRLETHCGVGLRNVLQRLDALYHEEWSFDLTDAPTGGARAQLRIPAAFERSAGRLSLAPA